MAQDDQMERLRRLRAARNGPSVRYDAPTGPYVPGSPYDSTPAPPPPPHRSHAGALIALLILCVVAGAVIAAVGYTLHSFHSAAGGPRKTVRFVVRPGETVSQIADDLQRRGLVSSSMLFQFYYRINGGAEDIHAGEHTLNTGMSMETVAAALQAQPVVAPTPITVAHGGTVTAGFPVHFLPGKRAEEIGMLLQKLGVVPEKDFMHEVQYGKFNYWFLQSRPAGASVDGFLYPGAPIIVSKHDSAHRIVNLMLQEFNRAFTPAMHLAAAKRHLNVFQIVTMASIIQRESVNPKDLPYISSVYWNRLNNATEAAGFLDADPTVQYAMGYRPDEKTWWEESPSKIDTSIDSPYNTYKHAGLPPGPISNSDLASLKAALAPARSDFLYFQVLSKDKGKTYHTYFCTTIECQTSQSGVRVH